IVLPFAEKEFTAFEKVVEVQLAPLSVEVRMTVPSAANSFVPALANELTPLRANCSATSQEAPSSGDRQMKLSSAMMIASALTNILFPSEMGEATSCQLFPLSVDRKTELPVGLKQTA